MVKCFKRSCRVFSISAFCSRNCSDFLLSIEASDSLFSSESSFCCRASSVSAFSSRDCSDLLSIEAFDSLCNCPSESSSCSFSSDFATCASACCSPVDSESSSPSCSSVVDSSETSCSCLSATVSIGVFRSRCISSVGAELAVGAEVPVTHELAIDSSLCFSLNFEISRLAACSLVTSAAVALLDPFRFANSLAFKAFSSAAVRSANSRCSCSSRLVSTRRSPEPNCSFSLRSNSNSFSSALFFSELAFSRDFVSFRSVVVLARSSFKSCTSFAS
mmetsp:Transcript_45744/g.110878  ORF Transcript_45744/g.110878 Transcript_45744/m.110878 type:complete len:275 (+) Transcript_45744:155-979(+)